MESPLSFYLFDHLGNTRVTFRADAADAIYITYAADYYPYGKILRQYKACNQNRYLSTHHERDKATGYDNRGARLYDSEIGRFLGVDPLAGKFAGHSPYNYVMGDPVSLMDPTGAYPENYTVYVDGERVSESEQGYWTRQIGVYNQRQNFAEAVGNAFLRTIYTYAAEMLEVAGLRTGAEHLHYKGADLSTKFSPPPQKFANHFETYFNNGSFQIGEHSIDFKEITYFHRGNDDIFTEIISVGPFSNKATLGSVGGSNLAYIYGKRREKNEVSLGPGRTPIKPGSPAGLTHIGTIELSSLEVMHYQNAARYLTRKTITNQINSTYESQRIRDRAFAWLKYNYPKTF